MCLVVIDTATYFNSNSVMSFRVFFRKKQFFPSRHPHSFTLCPKITERPPNRKQRFSLRFIDIFSFLHLMPLTHTWHLLLVMLSSNADSAFNDSIFSADKDGSRMAFLSTILVPYDVSRPLTIELEAWEKAPKKLLHSLMLQKLWFTEVCGLYVVVLISGEKYFVASCLTQSFGYIWKTIISCSRC